MSITRRTAITYVTATIPIVMLSTPAWAAGTKVTVSLWDKGMDSMLDFDPLKNMGMAMPNTSMSMGTMGITPSATEIPAGEVTFEATNDSTVFQHEMVLALVADLNVPQLYLDDDDKVDEDGAGHIGEVAELQPGETGALTVTLEPGDYILYCNIPMHYAMGMWTLIKVV